jgi:hypothetical protein
MAVFQSDQEVYARIGRVLRELAGDEREGAQLQRADTIVQYRLRDPEATVTVKALANQERQVEMGQTSLRPEVVVAMDADTAHALWCGELNVALALADGQVRPRGPSSKILALVGMLKLAIPRYQAQLEAPVAEPAADAPPAESVAEEPPEEPVAEEPPAEPGAEEPAADAPPAEPVAEEPAADAPPEAPSEG